MNEILVWALLLVPTQNCIDKAKSRAAGRPDALGLKYAAVLPQIEQRFVTELPKKSDGCNRVLILSVSRASEYQPGQAMPTALLGVAVPASSSDTAKLIQVGHP